MFGRSGYQAVPLGDFNRFQQSGTWLHGSQRGLFSPGHAYDPLDQVQTGIGAPQGFFSQLCHQAVIALVFLLTILTFPISGWFVLKTVPTYERVIVFRLGRIRAPKGPGLVLLLPFIDQWQRVDLRTHAFNIPPCKLTSQDGALVSVGADVQFRVCDPVLSVMTVKDLNMATRMTAQNVMTKILLKKYLREIQTEKLRISDQLLLEINDVTKTWGLEVDRVELILEAVLQVPPETVAGATHRMNSVTGMQGLDNTIQQLALHIFGKSLGTAGTSPKGPLDTVERVEVQSETAPINRTMVQDIRKHFDPEEFLLSVDEHLSESLVNQIRACYQFNILLPSGEQNTYYIDLSTGHGKTGHGLPDHNPDVVLEMAESDLGPLVSGDLNPLNAYVSGKLRAHGDLSKALKLEVLFRAMK
ncbi:PREDICTED: stomatin-like protein 1 isoform X2 [Gekko japonicus]|uniref:Stomatin-like protein 1 isoform X2 n=1 Tax=Gekko japonicus TaxID=146911 RepID=A0ABM1JUT3_GEKJA|nr:PREDICTED: stomatin-like protein 1 isoform X2 [Gekko japonicus]